MSNGESVPEVNGGESVPEVNEVKASDVAESTQKTNGVVNPDGEQLGKTTQEEEEHVQHQAEQIGAGKVFAVRIETEELDSKFGTTVSWYFKEQFEYDLSFAVYVTKEGSDDRVYVKHASRCTTSKGSFTTEPNVPCTVVFEWDNAFSYFNTKTIEYFARVTMAPEEAAVEWKKQQELERSLRVKRLNAKIQHQISHLASRFSESLTHLQKEESEAGQKHSLAQDELEDKKKTQFTDFDNVIEAKKEKSEEKLGQTKLILTQQYEESMRKAEQQHELDLEALEKEKKDTRALIEASIGAAKDDLNSQQQTTIQQYREAFASNMANLCMEIGQVEKEVSEGTVLFQEQVEDFLVTLDGLTAKVHGTVDSLGQ